MNCQDFEELVGAYALDAITEEERLVADEHLAQCAKCRLLLRELQSVVDLLPLSVPAVEPSPLLKNRILSTIQPNPVLHGNIQTPHRRAPRYSWPTQLIAAAAIVLLALLGTMTIWNISLQQQLAQHSVNVPSLTTYTIHGTGSAAAATGQLTYDPHLHATTLVLHKLPALTGTQVYQGWLIQGNHLPKSIGLLNVQGGAATLIFQGNVTGYDLTAVSLEPGPQASPDAPRGQIMATGSLQHPQKQT